MVLTYSPQEEGENGVYFFESAKLLWSKKLGVNRRREWRIPRYVPDQILPGGSDLFPARGRLDVNFIFESAKLLWSKKLGVNRRREVRIPRYVPDRILAGAPTCYPQEEGGKVMKGK